MTWQYLVIAILLVCLVAMYNGKENIKIKAQREKRELDIKLSALNDNLREVDKNLIEKNKEFSFFYNKFHNALEEKDRALERWKSLYNSVVNSLRQKENELNDMKLKLSSKESEILELSEKLQKEHTAFKEISLFHNNAIASLKNKENELAVINQKLSEQYNHLVELNVLFAMMANRCANLDARCNSMDKELSKRKNELDKQRKSLQFELDIVSRKVSEIPVLAKFFADLADEKTKVDEYYLRNKKHPAISAADIIRNIRGEKKVLVQKVKEYEFLIEYYKSLVPWLDDVEDDRLDNTDDAVYNPTEDELDDESGYWLTKEEYCKLSSIERNQRALDRYLSRHKSRKEIGNAYERYCGYLYEQKGYEVEYRGIIDGMEDHGRDLICTRQKGPLQKEILVIQCKCWSKNKVIHENHINQLLGTTLKYYFEINPGASIFDFGNAVNRRDIIPVFITSTVLSETALDYALALKIDVIQNMPLKDYPVIKCNNGKDGKIYHLPFDQKYDIVKMTKGKGEFYAMTVAEAEGKGYRRAKRWIGENTTSKHI